MRKIFTAIGNLFVGIGCLIREFFFSFDETKQKYTPSSRKFWATGFSCISALALISKFWLGNQNITSGDLTIVVSLATAAVGWYSLRQYVDSRHSSINQQPIPQTDNPNEMYIEDGRAPGV